MTDFAESTSWFAFRSSRQPLAADGDLGVLLCGFGLTRRCNTESLAWCDTASPGINLICERTIARCGFLQMLPAYIADIIHRGSLAIVGILSKSLCEIRRCKKGHDALHHSLATTKLLSRR